MQFRRLTVKGSRENIVIRGTCLVKILELFVVVAVFKIWQCLWPRENSIDRETWRATVHDTAECACTQTHTPHGPGKNVGEKLLQERIPQLCKGGEIVPSTCEMVGKEGWQ